MTSEPECLACGLPGHWVIRRETGRIWACSESCAQWLESNYPKPLDAVETRTQT